MRWLTKDSWKASIIITGILFFLLLVIGLPFSAVSAQERAGGLATPTSTTVQGTPTADVTVTELNKEKLAQEVLQLKKQNEPDLLEWIRTNASFFLSSLVVVIGALIGLWRWQVERRDTKEKESKDRLEAQNKELQDHEAERVRRDEEQRRWLEDQKIEREKRAEERFQSVVAGLGSEQQEASVGAAVMLRTFLGSDYKQFYIQVYDLAVAHLQVLPSHLQETQIIALRKALISVFTESFVKSRALFEGDLRQGHYRLDASFIVLDDAYLFGVDLQNIRMLDASLKRTHLNYANLYRAVLIRADLTGAKLRYAHLKNIFLDDANLSGADLTNADLTDVIGLEKVISFQGTDLRGVKGLSQEQKIVCKAKGAIIDEDQPTNRPQTTVRPTPSSQSDGHTPAVSPVQEQTKPPELGK